MAEKIKPSHLTIEIPFDPAIPVSATARGSIRNDAGTGVLAEAKEAAFAVPAIETRISAAMRVNLWADARAAWQAIHGAVAEE